MTGGSPRTTRTRCVKLASNCPLRVEQAAGGRDFADQRRRSA